MAFRTGNAFTAVVDPTALDDFNMGVEPGTVWMNTATGQFFINITNGVGTATWTLGSNTGGNASSTEKGEILIRPEAPFGVQATNTASNVNFEGASYLLTRKSQIDRITIKVTAGGTGTLRILFFQTVNGGSGIASRVASITGFTPGATGTFEVLFAEGTVTFQSGILYVLYGRETATSITVQTYKIDNVDLLVTGVPTYAHPTVFTTAILPTTLPATFDPRQTPTGQATGSNTDIPLIFRSRKL
jgi:hypothetical protein